MADGGPYRSLGTDATAALVVLPYCALAWRKIFGYIYINALGRDVYIWLTPGDWWHHPTYYSVGGSGITMFGRQLVYLSKFGHQRMPAARMQGEILRALRERHDLRIVATLREPGGKELYLFQRVRTRAGLAEDS